MNIISLISILTVSLLLRIFFIPAQNLLIEEAYYWNYAIHLDFGYLDHPPLVALLIKASTLLFGNNEWGVRFPALLCWGITAYFSYQWAELVRKGSGRYALFLISILPFFFVFSLFMTPDSPFMAAWSAGLYAIYRAVCRKEAKFWYFAGIALGLGFLSKYTMILLALTTGIYLLTTPQARSWFLRKEPYLAILIALCLFSPVIYWNATHDWISFTFQSTRRFEGAFRFTFHYLVGLLFLFLTPVGVIGFIELFKKKTVTRAGFDPLTIKFFRYYMLLPLGFFSLFSLTREIKFDWIGPIFLATIPWLAALMQNKAKLCREWFCTSLVLLLAYAAILFCIVFGRPESLNHALFSKLVSWDNLAQQFYNVATQLKIKGEEPVFVPIDSYGVASELAFYQEKHSKGKIPAAFPVHGADLFGFNSLMFNFWGQSYDLKGKAIILVGKDATAFDNPSIRGITTPLSPVVMIWGGSQGELKELRQFFYQVVRLNG